MNANVRRFETGATRDLDQHKLDFEGFLCPFVLERYAAYMHENRKLPDGSLRDSANWQLGIPVSAYVKSLFRHFHSVWKWFRGGSQGDVERDLCAVVFNAMGALHEILKEKREGALVPLPTFAAPGSVDAEIAEGLRIAGATPAQAEAVD